MPKTAIEGRSVHYALRGEGPPIILVHGAGSTHMLWEELIEELGGSFRVVAPDLPGHGLSQGRGFPTMGGYAGWLSEFVRRLGAVKPLLVGHSMGGAVVLEAALSGGVEPAALALISTGARLKVEPGLLEGLENDYQEALKVLAQLFPFEGKHPFEELSEETLKNVFCACNSFDRMHDLGRVRVPTLVVAGEKDRLTPLKFARYLAQNIKDATLVVLEGAAHNLPLTRAQELSEAIRSFAGRRFGAGGQGPGR